MIVFNPDHNPTVVGYENAMKNRQRDMEEKQMGCESKGITQAKIGDCYLPMSKLCSLEELTTAWTRSLYISAFTPMRILRHGPATIVFWCDGTKTVVKRAPDEPDNEYTAFTAALAIRIFGSNSKLKKIVKTFTEVGK